MWMFFFHFLSNCRKSSLGRPDSIRMISLSLSFQKKLSFNHFNFFSGRKLFGQARLNMNIHFYFHFLSIQTFFFHFHFLSDCRKLYGRATGHLSITICPSLCPPPISAYSLYKKTNPESLFVEKVIKCAITIYLGLEKAKQAIYLCQRLFFHI